MAWLVKDLHLKTQHLPHSKHAPPWFIKTSSLMLHMVRIIVSSQSHIKRINEHRRKNVEFLIVKPGGIYSDL